MDRNNVLKNMLEIYNTEVDRNNVLKNMLEIYNTGNDLENFHFVVKFKGENASCTRSIFVIYRTVDFYL